VICQVQEEVSNPVVVQHAEIRTPSRPCHLPEQFGTLFSSAVSAVCDDSLPCVAIEDVRSWTIATKEPSGMPVAAGYSPDGRWLAVGSRDGAIRIYEARTYALSRVLLGHKAGVDCVDWSLDSQRLATGGRDSTIRLWDLRSGRTLKILSGHAVVCSKMPRKRASLSCNCRSKRLRSLMSQMLH